MPERNLIEQFDRAVDAVLAGRPESAPLDPELASALVIAADLRDLPDPNFKLRLKGELMPSTMTAVATRHAVTPYFVVEGASDLIEFLKATFRATEMARFPKPDGTIMHAAVQIGDSIVEMGDASPEYKSLTFGIHVYLEDVDAAYARALAAGATTLRPPVDQFYGDREASVKDRFGNHWYIATHLEPGQPIRKGFRTITPFFHPSGADRMIDFLQSAFDAKPLEDPDKSPDGKIAHATLQIGDSLIELGEAHAEFHSMKMQIHLYVDDCDAVYERAVRAGAQTIEPPMDKPYGERNAWVTDPFGNHWFIATPK